MRNDDRTTIFFVAEVLDEVFQDSTPLETIRKVHRNGAASVGMFESADAHAKCADVAAMAQKAGFPLRCTVENADWTLANPQNASEQE